MVMLYSQIGLNIRNIYRLIGGQRGLLYTIVGFPHCRLPADICRRCVSGCSENEQGDPRLVPYVPLSGPLRPLCCASGLSPSLVARRGSFPTVCQPFPHHCQTVELQAIPSRSKPRLTASVDPSGIILGESHTQVPRYPQPGQHKTTYKGEGLGRYH